MLLILASRFDASAAALVRRWDEHGARLLTCEALSRRGWLFEPAEPARGSLVVDDGPVPVRSVRGAVSLLSGVYPGELPHIAAEDREYVAREMMAFLVAWLSSLPCPVLNRPTALCLTGPHLRHEQWLREAARAGLPISPWARRVPNPEHRAEGPDSRPPEKTFGMSHSARTVLVIAGRALPCPTGPHVPERVVAAVAAMASAVGAGLLTATFVEAEGRLEFAGAAPTVDVSRDDVADAMLAALEPAP